MPLSTFKTPLLILGIYFFWGYYSILLEAYLLRKG